MTLPIDTRPRPELTGTCFLNLGCGTQKIPGFTNIDVEPGADLVHDVTLGLPFAGDSIEAIYSEHFIEHLTQAQGVALLRECRRVLAPGSILRVATPDLDEIVARYATPEWLGSGLRSHGLEWVQNPCEMLNINMREWGHRHLYNETELVRLGEMAGLQCLGRRPLGDSDNAMLRGRETRPESLLIVEFAKPLRTAPATPLVSILIPAYNPRYFPAALQSALEQDYPALEIVISDDCPTSEIAEWAYTVAAGDRRVRYVRNDPPQGPRQNYIYCLNLARGEYIKFLNDDDLLAPGCVTRMAGCLRENPGVTLVTSHRQCIDADGQPLPDLGPTRRIVDRDCWIDGVSLAHAVIATGMNVVGEPTTAMFRRDDVQRTQPDFLCFAGIPWPGIGDVGAWMSLLSQGDAIYLVQSWSSFRQHSEQWQRQPGVGTNGENSWAKLRHHGARLGLHTPGAPPALRVRPLPDGAEYRDAGVYYAAACAARADGDLAGALELLQQALESDPLHAAAFRDAGEILLAMGDAASGRVLLDRAQELAGA